MTFRHPLGKGHNVLPEANDWRRSTAGGSVKQLIKAVIARTPLYHPLRDYVVRRRRTTELREWERRGKPAPPPHAVKQNVLREYSETYNLTVMVETGTFLGDMVEAMRGAFDRIYSIELSENLYKQAVRRFRGAKNVTLIHGDSGDVLGRLLQTGGAGLPEISQPTLFWLDAHYSSGVTARGEEETPIYEELRQILADHRNAHVIIIDDARCFGTDCAYPRMEDLIEFVTARRGDVAIVVKDDSIRITPLWPQSDSDCLAETETGARPRSRRVGTRGTFEK